MELFAHGNFTQCTNPVLVKLISNETGLTKNEIQVAFVIVRKTWGYGKWHDEISRSQIRKLTGLDVSAISRALKALRAREIIVKCGDYDWEEGRAYRWRIQDDTSRWITGKQAGDKKSPGRNHARKLVINHARTQGIIRVTTKDVEKRKEKDSRYIGGNPERTAVDARATSQVWVPIENRKPRY